MRTNIFFYLTATVLGGLHALEPGHGKTVVAAYLIGTKGRKIDAVILGLVVTVTHTFSVILLGIAAKVASTRITLTEESLHGYLGLVAGLLILIVGMWMLVARVKGREPFQLHSHHPDHMHTHGDHHDHGHSLSYYHHHDHDHSGDHSHDRRPDHNHVHSDANAHNSLHTHDSDHGHDTQNVGASGDKRIGYSQLLMLGVSGGLVPCPAAIAVLLAAVGAGRLAEGLTYILLFSLGLAIVLIAVGLTVVSAGKLAARFLDAKRFARWVGIGSAAIITLIGVVTIFGSVRHLV